ncbi:MAG: guanylate kinase [Desulfuromonadales bacterium]
MLYVISAPSGAGKTSICRKILQTLPDLHQSISYTTRPMRDGERDGADYHFVTTDVFQQMVSDGAFAEWAEVHGNCYGTARASLEKAAAAGADILLDIDFQGAEQLRYSGLEGVFIFILPPGMDELRRRLDARNTDDDRVIERRMRNAAGEISAAVKFDYLVVNDVLESAADTIMAIMKAENARTRRMVETLPEEFGLK